MPAVPLSASEQARIREIATSLDLLSEQDFVLFCGVTPTTAEAWRKRHSGPPYVLVGTRYFYPRADVAEFLKTRVRSPRGVEAGALL